MLSRPSAICSLAFSSGLGWSLKQWPAAEVVSHFNRLSPESPGGSSLVAVVQGTDVDPDPFGLRLWKHGQLFVSVSMMIVDLGDLGGAHR